MSDAVYTVTFRATSPDLLRVGDQLFIHGKATVHAIRAELINITALGSEIEQTVGETSIDLYANTIEVAQA